MKHFRIYSRQDILKLTNIRKFETKLGERVLTVKAKTDIQKQISTSPCKWVIFGIPEDIGVRGNIGRGGADTVWPSFLSSFLNIQSNDFLSGEDLLMLGRFDFTDLRVIIEQNAYNQEEKINAYRHAVITVDEEVEELVKIISSSGKIPIAIGGGHNNAYPLLKGAAKGLHHSEKIQLAQINCINLDAHSDYRPIEGRHSGNAFRYAEEDGFLSKYSVIAVHENYIPQNVSLDMMNNPSVDFISYEDIFLHEKKGFIQSIAHAVEFTGDNYVGIELDLDAIENTLSSAEAPTGLTALHARQYINYTAKNCKVAYLHICEGATELENGRSNATTGKLISYLVSDFLKV